MMARLVCTYFLHIKINTRIGKKKKKVSQLQCASSYVKNQFYFTAVLYYSMAQIFNILM